MNSLILKEEVQSFIHQDEFRDPHKITLGKSPFDGVSTVELAQQIDSRQRSKQKLPTWYQCKGIYYAPKVSIEQSSSEIAAKYKADIVGPAHTLADLTGGMGVDSFYFSKNIDRIFHCEILNDLSIIAQQNHQQLGANNITHINRNGLEWLAEQDDMSLDVVYLDPARRNEGKRVFKLEDCFPNFLEFQELIFQKTSKVCLKVAPLLDIKNTEDSLQYLEETHVLSIQNDCKEVLFILNKNRKGTPLRICTAFRNGEKHVFEFNPQDEINLEYSLGEFKEYLYEPDVALLKAGAFKSISEQYKIVKIHPNTHLYTSNELREDFIGKITKINQVIPYSKFKKQKSKDLSAIVVSKNFPMKADELRKKHKISENSTQHLYFLKNKDQELVVVDSTTLPIH